MLCPGVFEEIFDFHTVKNKRIWTNIEEVLDQCLGIQCQFQVFVCLNQTKKGAGISINVSNYNNFANIVPNDKVPSLCQISSLCFLNYS